MAELITRKRGSKWEYQFEVATVAGKRKRISKSGFKTKGEAVREGTKAKAQYDNTGLVFTPSDVSVSDYLDYFYSTYVVHELKPSTQEFWESFIRLHYKPWFGKYRLSSITPAMVQDFLYEYKAKGYSRKTVVHLRNNLKEAFAYAINPCGFIADNPVEKTSMPKMDADQVNPHFLISIEDYQKIIEHFHFGTRYHVMLQLGWNLGLRLGEITGLQWSDIDFENNTVRVDKQALYSKRIPERKSDYHIGTPKTAHSVRTIPFGSSLRTLLLKEKKRQEDNRENYGRYYTEQYLVDGRFVIERQIRDRFDGVKLDFVCRDENGTWVNPSMSTYCIRVVNKKLHINFDFHSLRVSNATHLIDNKVDIKVVQQRLGHANIATTYDSYVRVTDEMSDEAVSVLDTVLSTEKNPVDKP